MALAPTGAANRPEVRSQSYLWMLYIFSFFVMVRSLFRAIEFIEGSDGVLQTTEAYFYVLDPLLMYLAVIYLHWKQPGEIAALQLLRKPSGMSWERLRL